MAHLKNITRSWAIVKKLIDHSDNDKKQSVLDSSDDRLALEIILKVIFSVICVSPISRSIN